MNVKHQNSISKQRLIRTFCVVIAAGVFLTILAPLGTSYLGLGERLVYWVVLCIAGWCGGTLAEWTCKKYFPGLPVLWLTLLVSLLAAIFVYIALFTLFMHLPITAGLTSFFYVLVISVAITSVGQAFRKDESDPISANSDQPAIIERLPVEMRDAEIYAISAEDHYVKVHTSSGHTMVLMRFKDAVRETAPLAGIVTHRSWWIAQQGVKSIKKKSRTAELILKNDVQAQVSRNGLKEMRESGWVE